MITWTRIRSRISIGCTRIILTRSSFLFFIVAFISGIAQIGIVSTSFSTDLNAWQHVMDQLNAHGGADDSIVTMFRYNTSTNEDEIELCTQINDPVHPHPCTPITIGRLSPNVTAGEQGLQCQQVLNYPLQLLALSQREDVFCAAMNSWLLVIAAYGVMAESIPHISAYFISKLLTTIWTVWTVIRLPSFESQFTAILQFPCNLDPSSPLLSTLGVQYFQQSNTLFVTSAIVNIVSLLVAGQLTWNLVQTYAQQTYSRVVASKDLIGKYKIVLTLNAAVQSGLFFFVASSALWLDRLRSNPIQHWVRHPVLYQAMFWTGVIVIPFWSLMGWYGVRREKHVLMVGYVAIGLALIACSSAIFDAVIYRWYFLNWSFWGAITITSMVLLTTIVVLTVVCWRNFGLGVSHWLRVNRVLADANFKPSTFITYPPEGSDVPRRPSSIYNVPLRRMSSGLSFEAERKWSDPFIDAIGAGKVETGLTGDRHGGLWTG